MTRARLRLLTLLPALLLTGCASFLDARTTRITVVPPGDSDCIRRALEETFGSGTVRVNARGDRYLLTAFPWEGQVIRVENDAGTRLDLELHRVRRYDDGRGPTAAMLRRVRAALLAACHPITPEPPP